MACWRSPSSVARQNCRGRSVSDVVVAAAHDAAQRAIEEAQLIGLSVEDQRRFVERCQRLRRLSLIDRDKQKISRLMPCKLKRRIFGPLFDFIPLGPVHHPCGNFAEEALRFQEFLISFQHFQKT